MSKVFVVNVSVPESAFVEIRSVRRLDVYVFRDQQLKPSGTYLSAARVALPKTALTGEIHKLVAFDAGDKPAPQEARLPSMRRAKGVDKATVDDGVVLAFFDAKGGPLQVDLPDEDPWPPGPISPI